VRVSIAATGYALAGAATAAVSLATARYYGHLSFDVLFDPDSWTRAVLLRQGIENGAFAQSLARDASGAGTSIHWSRLLEFLALPFVLGLEPWLGLERAVTAVGAMIGPISLGCLAAALCWAARPFVAWRPALIFVPAATAMAPVLKNYGMPGVFGHHIAIAACLAMAGGCAARACRDPEAGIAAATGAGLWCGIGTWFSAEAAPLTFLPIGGLGVAWIVDGGKPGLSRLTAAGLAFLGVVAFAWLVDRPNGGWFSVEADRVSYPYVVLLAFWLVAVAVLFRLVPRSPAGRIAAALAVGLPLAGCWLALFPQFTGGLGQFMPPEVKARLWDNINEMKPAATAAQAIEYGFGGIVSLVAFSLMAIGLRRDRRGVVLVGYVGLCAVVLLALGTAHLRFSAYGSCLGAVAVAILVSRLEEARGLVPGTLAGAVLLIFVPLLIRVTAAAAPASSPAPDCSLAEAARWLETERGVVLADINDGPELLWRTPVETVATLYHRGGIAQARWLAAMRAVDDGAAAAALDAAKVEFVLLCAAGDGGRPPYLADLPETAIERWQVGALPPWLHKIREDAKSGLTLLQRRR
jgi:hypothetical protein